MDPVCAGLQGNVGLNGRRPEVAVGSYPGRSLSWYCTLIMHNISEDNLCGATCFFAADRLYTDYFQLYLNSDKLVYTTKQSF